MAQNQKTIKKEVLLQGVGVHSGVAACVRLKPESVDHGIRFVNRLFPDDCIKIGNVAPVSAVHATVLRAKEWRVSTVEHLLAAIIALGIDNISIEVDGPEIPILDGSALPFVLLIEQAGVKELDAPKQFIMPKKEIIFEDADGRFLSLAPPGPGVQEMVFKYSIEFAHQLVKNKQLSGRLTAEFFAQDIAPARTFGFLEQLSVLRKHGLAQGTTLGNTVVVGEYEFLNECRFEDEFVRHKVLDLIGDLALLGRSLVAYVRAHKTGHNFNRLVVEHYLNNPHEWLIKK